MVLSDLDIQEALSQGSVIIEPFFKENLKSGSYTLSLGSVFYRLKQVPFLDMRESKQSFEEVVVSSDGFILNPGEFIICQTREKIRLAENISALLSTRGSKAQAGLHILLGSFFVEPGTNNHIALELHNVSTMPMKLFPDVPVVKIIFSPLSSLAERAGQGSDFFSRKNT